MFNFNRCPKCRTPLSKDVLNGLCPRCVLAAAMSDEGDDSTAPWVNKADGSFVPPSVAELQPKFPELQITELVGTGGMGAVYRALQPGLDRIVALKILPAERNAGAEFAERFSREAKMMAMLTHPNIVAVHDFGRKDDLCYIVMEYVEGTTLRNVIRAGQSKPDQALAIIGQVASAMQYAHEQGIVHRDIKPENVLIDLKGRVKIADFGLAKVTNRSAYEGYLTRTQQVMGTLRYMAPEQIERTRDVDHRADIYSLGVVMYELLTRELPLGRFPLPSEKLRVDKRLDQIVLKALEKSPEKRYQRASEINVDLAALQSKPQASWNADTIKDRLRLERVPAPMRPLAVFGVVLAIIIAISVGKALFIAAAVLLGIYWASRTFWSYVNHHTGINTVPGLVGRAGQFAWHYNPLAVAYRTLQSRKLWIGVWGLACIGLYIGLWWPSYNLGGRNDPQTAQGPGVIDAHAWPYEGSAESYVRLTPKQDLYESLSIRRSVAGRWDGYYDVHQEQVPVAADEHKYLLTLQTLDGKTHELLIDNIRGVIVCEDLPARETGPIDTRIMTKWLSAVIAKKSGPAIEEHAKVITDIITRAAAMRGFAPEAYRSVNGRLVRDEGRMAAAVSTMGWTRNPNPAFKEWVGSRSADFRRSPDNLIPVGLATTAVLFGIGYWALRKRPTKRTAANPSTVSSLA